MNLEEMVARLNVLQTKAFGSIYGLTTEEKNEWRTLSTEISKLGYKLSRHRVRDFRGYHINTIWKAKAKNEMGNKFVGNWIIDEHEKNHNTECTTRALYFCFDHTIPYQSIREEQNRRAQRKYGIGRCKGWNTEPIWGELLIENGYRKVVLPYGRRVYSGVLAMKLANIDTKVIVHTNRHLSACYKGSIIDDWDSRKKIVESIYVKEDKIAEVKYALAI